MLLIHLDIEMLDLLAPTFNFQIAGQVSESFFSLSVDPDRIRVNWSFPQLCLWPARNTLPEMKTSYELWEKKDYDNGETPK